MAGAYVGSKPIRVNVAKKEKKSDTSRAAPLPQPTPYYQPPPNYYPQANAYHSNYGGMGYQPVAAPVLTPAPNFAGNRTFYNKTLNLHPPQPKEPAGHDNPHNTVLFVGGLGGFTTEDDVYRLFLAYGEIQATKLSLNRDCAFVKYYRREDALKAFVLHGTLLDGKMIHVNWGNSPDLKTTFKTERHSNVREKFVEKVEPPCMFSYPSDFQQPFDTDASNKQFLQKSMPYVESVTSNFLYHVSPSPYLYKNLYY